MSVGLFARNDMPTRQRPTPGREETRTPGPRPADSTGAGVIAPTKPASTATTTTAETGAFGGPVLHAEFVRPKGPAHARSGEAFGSKHIRLLLAVGAAVATILFALVVVTVVVKAVDGMPASIAPLHPPLSVDVPARQVSSGATVGRVQDATGYVASATSAVQSGFASFSGIPTTAKVATVTDPFVDSLQLYDTVLASTTLSGQAARKAAGVVDTEVQSDIAYLQTLNAVTPVHLGTYLNGVLDRIAQLQASVSSLQQTLH